MPILFISDLHLDQSRPEIIALFRAFLTGEARQAEALYILGDLFESWIGDDDDAPLGRAIAMALSDLSCAGVPCYFMHGNRDFLLGNDYANRSGLRLLADPTVVDLYGQPTMLMHGDTLCTDDHAYQKFREQVHNPQWQKIFLTQSLSARREFAQHARTESQRHTSSARSEIMDVNPDAVIDSMQTAGVRRLIHGHTHRPALHDLRVAHEPAQRAVLGDWYEQGSVLRVDAKGIWLGML